MTEKRDYHFDNIKFVLVLLVVLGHFIEPVISKSANFKTLWIFIYSFHAPLFVFISGYFSKNINDPNYRRKNINNILLPYIVFQIINCLYDFLTMPKYKFSMPDLLFKSNFALWFLFSLFIWKVILPYAVEIKYFLVDAVILAILVGYGRYDGYFLNVSRTVVFFPFFLLGYYTKKEHLQLFQINKYKSTIALMIIFVFMYNYTKTIDARWFLGSITYANLGHIEWIYGFYRLFFYLLAVVMSIYFINLIPTEKTFFSERGQYTLYVYLLHGFIFKLLYAIGYYNSMNFYKKLFIIILSFILPFVLSSERVVKFTSFLVTLKNNKRISVQLSKSA